MCIVQQQQLVKLINDCAPASTAISWSTSASTIEYQHCMCASARARVCGLMPTLRRHTQGHTNSQVDGLAMMPITRRTYIQVC